MYEIVSIIIASIIEYNIIMFCLRQHDKEIEQQIIQNNEEK